MKPAGRSLLTATARMSEVPWIIRILISTTRLPWIEEPELHQITIRLSRIIVSRSMPYNAWLKVKQVQWIVGV